MHIKWYPPPTCNSPFATRILGYLEPSKPKRGFNFMMKRTFNLPSWMSPSVAHSHEILLKLARVRLKQDNYVGYFLNSEETSFNPRSDAPKNRSVRFDLEVDADGSIKE